MITTIIIAIITVLLMIGAYFYLNRYEERDSINELTNWLVISVALALIPLVFNALVFYLTGATLSFVSLMDNGELFIISLAIGIDAASKLFGSSETRKPFKILAGGGCLFLTALSALLFSVTSRGLIPTLDSSRIAYSSSVLFLLTMVAGGSCALLAEVKK